MAKLRVGVIFGGRSGEHEVSVASAAAIFRHLDPARYEAVPIRIDKQGRWQVTTSVPTALSAAEVIAQGPSAALAPVEPSAIVTSGLDVVFPVLHGPYGEDGTVQGLLELANVPYVGAGVLGSAVGMDKHVMKMVFAAARLPVAPWITVLRHQWDRQQAALTSRVTSQLGYPVFVKPANLGSSVGISRVTSEAGLAEAMTLALQFDRKIVIEAAIPEAREIEVAVIGNDDPVASLPGEIVPSGDFYDYASKYLDGASRELIPAPLTSAQTSEFQRLAVEAYTVADLSGMSRVDFLMSRTTGAIVLNEVNTIPGFTTISMYPKMWEASGLAYPKLLDRLIELALERHAAKQQLKTSIT